MKISAAPFYHNEKPDETEDAARIARAVGSLIERTAFDIFVCYRENLIKEPITYVVPAICLENDNKELDAIQASIHKKVSLVVDEIYNLLNLKEMTKAQEFAAVFLIRGLFISKISYMVEAYKNQRLMGAIQGKCFFSLEDAKPLGNA